MARNSVNALARKAMRLEGLEDVLGRLENVIDRTTGKEAKEIMLKAGLILRDDARDRAPVQTGALKRAIFAARGDENKPNVLVGVNYKIAPHAHLVEFGTVKTNARPYMRPAISSASPKMAQTMKDGFEKIIKDAANGRN